ncbi:MAG: flagellar basal body rod protein FlgB [Thermodesulfovibrionales bacterium]|nr:flagellar basal body rod protein FlgB [Thermodesulfovibrionales bacterium]
MADGFKILEGLLYATKARHSVIASNIANVDTPYYKAKDLTFEMNLKDEVIALKVTNESHITNIKPVITTELNEETTQQWLDQNNVELDMEVAKMTENAILYQAGINMLSTKIKMFKGALRRS